MSGNGQRIFISHASRDAVFATALAGALEESGDPCWISSRDVAPGANYQESIVAAITGARAMVLLLTEAANASDEVKKELSLASAQGIAVYPVRLGSVQPNAALRYELATRQWIDGGDVAVLAARLAAAIQGTVPQLPSPDASAPLALPDKPSLVVLPFQNMSGDPEQEYFADGMVEDITTALSCIRALFVIARNSAFTYKGRAIDVRQVGRDLGVRYVLEGSVRKASGKLRITGQLVDTITGAHLWAGRFDGGVEDVFDLQDQVTASVAGAIAPQLEQAEIERAQRKPTHDLNAYDFYLRGIALAYQEDVASMREAQALFAQAYTSDPGYGVAYGAVAFVVTLMKSYGLVSAQSAESTEAIRLARLAAANARNDATALVHAANVLNFVAGDLEGGRLLSDRACALNPNYAHAWNTAGWSKLYTGELAAAIESMAKATRLSPLDPFCNHFDLGTAMAHFFAGRYDESVAFARRSFSRKPHPDAQRFMAAALALSGQLDEARVAIAEMVKLAPKIRLSNMADWMPAYRCPEYAVRLLEGLRLAGMPE